MRVSVESVPRGVEMGMVARCLGLGGGIRENAVQIAVTHGYPERVVSVLKHPVPGATTADPDYASLVPDALGISAGFIDAMKSRSVFVAMLSDIERVPFRTRAVTSTADATAWAVGEGKPIPISRMALANHVLVPQPVASIVTISKELIEASEPSVIGIINRSLRNAASRTVDEVFFNSIIDSSTPFFEASGSSAESARHDIVRILDVVNTRATGRLYWAASPTAANRLAIVDPAITGMSPNGGEFLNLPVVVSDAVPAYSLFLIDAGKIAGNAGVFTVEESIHASLEMESSPEQAPDSPAHMVSLWQTNMVGFKVAGAIGAEVIAPDALACITNIDWVRAGENGE